MQKMTTKTVPAHVVVDEQDDVQVIIIRNDKTRAVEFFSVNRMGFQEVGEFLNTTLEIK